MIELKFASKEGVDLGVMGDRIITRVSGNHFTCTFGDHLKPR